MTRIILALRGLYALKSPVLLTNPDMSIVDM